MVITRRGDLIKSACRSCPLYKSPNVTTWKVPLEFQPNREGTFDVLLLGPAPGARDDSSGKPYAGGKVGRLIRDVVRRANAGSLDGVAFDYAVRCRPAGDLTKPLACCSAYSSDTISAFGPKVVVLMGSAAQQEFAQTPPLGEHVKKSGTTYICTVDPDQVAKDGLESESGRILLRDIRRAMKLAGRITGRAQAEAPGRPGVSILVKSVREVRRIVNKILALPKGSVVAVDTEGKVHPETGEMTRVDPGSHLVSFQFSWDGETAYVIPTRHPQSPFFPRELRQVYALLRKLFTAKTILRDRKGRAVSRGSAKAANAVATDIEQFVWLFHNANFDLHQIRRELGVTVANNPNVDTMEVMYAINENCLKQSNDPGEFFFPGRERGLSLAGLIKHYLGKEYAYEDADKSERFQIDTWAMDRFVNYAGKDTWALWRLFQELLLEAEEQGYRKQLLNLLYNLYSGANLMVVEMERNGFLADIDHLRELKNRATSPMLREMEKLIGMLRQSPHAQKVNDDIWRKEGGGSHALWGGTPWRLTLSKDAHLRALFFEEMKIEPVSHTEGGTPQVNKKFYETHGRWSGGKPYEGDPLNEVAIVADWNACATLMNSFVKSIYQWIHPDTGHPDMRHDQRVRGRFQLTATTTGRVAHKDPNMGQFPRADNTRKRLTKNIFIAERGRVILACDLKGNEVRWGANEAGDEALGALFVGGQQAGFRYRNFTRRLAKAGDRVNDLYREYLLLEKRARWVDGENGKKNPDNEEARRIRRIAKEGGAVLEKILLLRVDAELRGDIHKQTASSFFGVPIDEVTKVLRTQTKAIVFGYMYGRSVGSIAEQIGKEWKEAKQLCDGFDRRYPKFAKRLSSWPEEAEGRGYVESLIGRRRRFNSKIWTKAPEWVAAKARRQAKNSPIQGIASDSCLIAATLLYRYIIEHGLQDRWKLVNIVHDAIYLEVPYEDIRAAAKIMEWALTKGLMEFMTEKWGVKFVAPMECDFAVGVLWGELYEWDFSEPHFDIVAWRVGIAHKKKWGEYPDGYKKYETVVERGNPDATKTRLAALSA